MNRSKYILFAVYMSFFYGNCLSNLVDFFVFLDHQTLQTIRDVKVKNFIAYCVACTLYQIAFPYLKWPFTNDLFRQHDPWKLSTRMITLLGALYGPLSIGFTNYIAIHYQVYDDGYNWNRILLSVPMSFFITGLLELGGLFRYARLELLLAE